MNPRVKLTDLQGGQDYFLLVTKMNLTGLRVESARTLAPGTPVHLSIQIEEGEKSVELEGEVHTVAERPGGRKGMVIRFVDPDPSMVARIEVHLNTAKTRTKRDYGSAPTAPPSSERTMMVSAKKFDAKLAAASKEPAKGLPSTWDEEGMQAASLGLDGKTRINAPEEFQKYLRQREKPKRRRRFWGFLVLLLLIAGLYNYRGFLKSLPQRVSSPIGGNGEPAPQIKPSLSPSPSPLDIVTPVATERRKKVKPENLKSSSTPVPAPAPPAAAPKIQEIQTEDGGAYVKVTIQGTAKLDRYEISRAMNPRRLIVDFPEIRSFTVDNVITVSKNPLFRVKTDKGAKGTQVILDLYPVVFPRYEVKAQPDKMEIFLRR